VCAAGRRVSNRYFDWREGERERERESEEEDFFTFTTPISDKNRHNGSSCKTKSP
jgi:hypothetical protein